MQNLDNQEGNEGKQAANRGWSWLIPVAAILVACFVIACSTTVLGWSVYVTERRTTRASVLVPTTWTATRAATSPATRLEILPLVATPTAVSTAATATRPVVVAQSVLQTPGARQYLGSSAETEELAAQTPLVAVISSTLTAMPETGLVVSRTIQSVTKPTATASPPASPVVSTVLAQVPTTEALLTDVAENAPLPQLHGHIIFPAYNPASGSWDLHITRADGTERGFLHAQGSQPAFSPDGQYVAFRYTHPSYLGLAYMNLASGQTIQLTHYAEDAWPSWSYDVGSLLVFSSQRQPDRRWRIYGLLSTTQTDWELSVNNKPVYGHYPGWASENRLLYTGCVQAQCGIMVADGDASNPRQLTDEPENYTPDASPDGNWVAFVKKRDTAWGIFIVDSRNSAEWFPLLDSEANEGSPEWSPDGSYLAFVSDLGGVPAVWAVASESVRSDERSVPIKLFDLTEVPGDGWPWLNERIAWGP